MPVSRDEWLRSRAQERRPPPSVESCHLSSRPDGGWDVVIRGRHLSSGPVPLLVRLGGRPVRRVVTTGGTVVRGVVSDGRAGDEVVVDLGPSGRLTTTVDRVS